jgi:hypothetical protein
MTFDTDPHRILGLVRGAPLDEVKRAYRRLAKANHPDAAGAGDLSRFLAIQTAYEQLLAGSKGAGATARGPGAPSPRPSQADPERADATRRAYGGRPRARRRPASEQTRRPGAGDGPSSSDGSEPRGKATLGSTSYDGADAGPFEPDWGGASWYGTSSGTYWTLNPKEYADPRKHGPEYQARARRASTARARADARAPEVPDTTEADAETAATAAETTAAAGPASDPAGAPADLGRTPTDTPAGDLRSRIVRALVRWLRIR